MLCWHISKIAHTIFIIFRLCDGVGEVYIWGVVSVMGKLMLNGLGFPFCAIKKVLHFRMGLCKMFSTIFDHFS